MESIPRNYPGRCNANAMVGRYVRKHNPFISFDNIRNNATRCRNIVNSDELDRDLLNGNLPQYMYYTPNLDNDGHDTGIAYAGRFLQNFFANRLQSFPKNTLIVITWDEDDKTEGNRVFTVLIGSMIIPRTTDHTLFSHYSLLKTVEENWNLGNLGRNEVGATPFFNSTNMDLF